MISLETIQKTPACTCRLCRIPCKIMPGFLMPADLPALIGDADPFVWAKEHLVAKECGTMFELSSQGNKAYTSVPNLLPKKKADGSCHWYENNRCSVHEIKPFGCAYFSQHISDSYGIELTQFTSEVRIKTFEDETSLYRKIYDYLVSIGQVKTIKESIKDKQELTFAWRKINQQMKKAS